MMDESEKDKKEFYEKGKNALKLFTMILPAKTLKWQLLTMSRLWKKISR